MSAVSGTLSIPHGSALARNSLVTVQIQDISRADAAAGVIGETLFSGDEREIPFEFETPFDLTDVDPRFTYSVGAGITGADERLKFISTRVHPVITRGAPTHDVGISLDPVEP